MKFLIIGCGLSGAVMAHRLSQLHHNILILERNPFVGGLCHDSIIDGTNIHTFGPHIFHSNDVDAINFVKSLCDWREIYFRVHINLGNITIPLPINLSALQKISSKSGIADKLIQTFGLERDIQFIDLLNPRTDDKDILQLFDYLKKEVFIPYSRKRWGCDLNEIDSSCYDFIPIIRLWDEESYFDCIFQAIPIKGYVELFKNLLDSRRIRLEHIDYWDFNISYSPDVIIWTGCVDELGKNKYGELPYRGAHYEINSKSEDRLPAHVVNFPKHPSIIRKIDYTQLNGDTKDTNVISTEFPSEDKKFYAVINNKSMDVYRKYKESIKNLLLLGRLATFRNLSMDRTIKEALQLANKFQ